MKLLNTLIIAMISVFVINIASPEKTFGKFTLIVNRIDKCKGPKRKDCATWSAEIAGKDVYFNVSILEDIASLKGKVVVSSNGKDLFRLQMNKVCDHLFLKPLFEELYEITDKCVMLKKDYTFSINMEEVVQRYYGGAFFYGNVTFKSVFNNNQCNFICVILDVTLSPMLLN